MLLITRLYNALTGAAIYYNCVFSSCRASILIDRHGFEELCECGIFNPGRTEFAKPLYGATAFRYVMGVEAFVLNDHMRPLGNPCQASAHVKT